MKFTDPTTNPETVPAKQRGAFMRWRKIFTTPISDRFWSKVDKRGNDECWPFLGEINPDGYGIFTPWANKVGRCMAHRKAWEIINGPIPEGHHICHHCDNPPCCNPKHLFSGTDKDNVDDMIRKGRARHPKGIEHGSAKLTELQVRQIRASYVPRKVSLRYLASVFGVDAKTIRMIVLRRKWKHLI